MNKFKSFSGKSVSLLSKPALLGAFMFIVFNSYGQDQAPPAAPPSAPPSEKGEEMHDRVEALKVGFLTKKLDLTPEEAKTFWPVYNQYEDEMEKVRKARRQNLTNAKNNFEEMSNADVEKA